MQTNAYCWLREERSDLGWPLCNSVSADNVTSQENFKVNIIIFSSGALYFTILISLLCAPKHLCRLREERSDVGQPWHNVKFSFCKESQICLNWQRKFHSTHKQFCFTLHVRCKVRYHDAAWSILQQLIRVKKKVRHKILWEKVPDSGPDWYNVKFYFCW